LTLSLWPVVFIAGLNRIRQPRSITGFDYQAQQLILRNTYLYPNIPLARIFQNKLQIPVSKFENNLTSMLDSNNYFFGYHPREITGVDSPAKFPFVALPFFFLGLLNIVKLRRYKLLLGSLVGLILGLSLIENYYYFDFPLYFPLALIFIRGVNSLPAKYNRPASIYYLLSLPLIIIELVRQLIIFWPK
jgi:hypothetical protein